MILQLKDAIHASAEKVLNPQHPAIGAGITANSHVLVVLAAGKGTRFGHAPKCIQLVAGTPLARHSINEFHRFSQSPTICLVGYRHEEVTAALGPGSIFVHSANPKGGTAFAAMEAFSVPGLLEQNPLLTITMGDRIVPSSIFRRLAETHTGGEREAALTILTAIYEPPMNRGKGRVLRDANHQVSRIVEEKDILAMPDETSRQSLLDLTEGNCPLYVMRAATLHRYAQALTNNNAQGQFYITDIIEAISRDGGEIRTSTTNPSEPEYDLLCSDVTKPLDLALLEGILASKRGMLFSDEIEIEEAARDISAGRPLAQVASIALQLSGIMEEIRKEKLPFDPEQPVAIGIAGGRLRLAFMHPDMVRFHGPAWQMPIGAGDETGEEQIVLLLQAAGDHRIHLHPIDRKYRESINYIPADNEALYPGEHISDLNAYEAFGTNLSENLLLQLGYFSDEELETRRTRAMPLPQPTLWVSNNMRRPFALVDNAIASMRTLRTGNLGARVQQHLGRDNFRGLRLVTTGNIPQGGFSSSSAVTVATENAVNALFDLRIPADMLVHLACQAEYGTGVRAGSLDQATEQKGKAGEGTLISSNPRDNYQILGTYPFPADRIRILFPYSVDRDRSAWRWSCGAYAESAGKGQLTTGETRKMTGKSAELAAVLVRLPIDTDFFQQIEADLLSTGALSRKSREWIASILLELPLLACRDELRKRAFANRQWYAEQLIETAGIDRSAAMEKAGQAIESIFIGWRDPESGVPLRAMVAYLFGEVAKNFHLIHHPDEWIEYVTLSQRGDCSIEIDVEALPAGDELASSFEWERGASGPDLLNRWMERIGAKPFEYNRGLDDATLRAPEPPQFHRLEGSNFFRGLALIDLAEAMLKRKFGGDSVAVRVNAAGQGDYFQVHVNRQLANPAGVKEFLRKAFYRRFGLTPQPEFVEVHPGGGAAGVRLKSYDVLTQLIQRLRLVVPL